MVWVLLLLAALSVWVFHSMYLVVEYRKYDVTTKSEIQRAAILEFPAVTICNQNPVRWSAIVNDSNFKTIIDSPSKILVL